MAQPTILGGVIQFMDKIGVYDVVLPFLLVFTIVFAILEKTKVLGTQKISGESYPKKTANSVAAFAISFFVIASAQLVQILTQVSSQVVILLLVSVFFLMLVGSFYGKDEEVKLEGSWRTTFMVIMFVGIVFIFLNAIKSGNQTWLQILLAWLARAYSSSAIASILFIIFILIFMYWVTTDRKPEKGKDKK